MAQLKYEYTFDLKYKNKSDGKITQIDQNNIKSLTIYKEYDKYNMPICTMNLVLDKNLADDIIIKMEENTFILTAYKIQADNESAVNELYFTEEFSYLTDDDTNKGKSLDYMKTDDKEDTREDVYRYLKIGLISKSLVDSNLHPNNATIYNSSMQDIVVDLLNIGVPLLVEPFTETETVSQLIIPPKESISKTLDYLNTVRVFYSTGYRFFMDFENTYLVSKAGKATLRTLDKYETVKFNLAELGSNESLLEGFKDDGESKSYIIDVPTTDIKYGKDNVLNKELNGFTAVIDASKTIQQDYMSKSKGFGGILGTYQNIMNTIDNIKKTTAGVRNIVKNIHRTTYDIKEHFNQIVEQATSVKSTVDSVASQAETLLRSLPEEVIGEGKKRILGGADGKTVVDSNLNIKNFLRGLITNSMDMSTISRTTVEGSEDTFNKFKQKYTGQIYHLENFKSLVGAIDPINFTDNTSEMLDQVKNIQPKKDESREHHTKSMVKFNEEYGKYIGNNKFLVDTLKDAPDTMTFVLEYDEMTHEIKRTFDLDLRSLKSHFKELKENLDFSTGKAKTISDFTETMDNSLKVNSNVGKSLSNIIKTSAQTIPKDFSKQILEGANTYVKSLQDTTKTAVNDAKQAANKVVESYGALQSSLSSLYQSGATTINSFSDLSKMGSNGESMVDVALDLVNVAEDLGKRKLIRIPNDNMGLIKNFKHALELKSTYLTINKQQLDNSLFNINMKYIINNKDDHKDDTGEYLLLSKVEVYTNYGEKFTSNTSMNFAKIPRGNN
jgi:hypothetical protein